MCLQALTAGRAHGLPTQPFLVLSPHIRPPPPCTVSLPHIPPPPPSSCGSLFNTGFDIPLSGWLEYLGFIADLAKSLGLAVGLKNSQVLLQANPQIIDKFDWAVNEGEDRGMAYRGCRD